MRFKYALFQTPKDLYVLNVRSWKVYNYIYKNIHLYNKSPVKEKQKHIKKKKQNYLLHNKLQMKN